MGAHSPSRPTLSRAAANLRADRKPGSLPRVLAGSRRVPGHRGLLFPKVQPEHDRHIAGGLARHGSTAPAAAR